MFGSQCPPVTAFKWATGHLIAGAGIMETTVALAALRRNVVPGIATLATPAPECAQLALSRAAQAPRSDVALVLCRGFGATDAALLVRATRS
jgi:3-oxoacyl-[acyl-carrier-protein] synthase-1